MSAKWSDLNTRRGEGEGSAASRREGKVIVGVAACSVGAMTSLLLWIIMYTERRKHGQNFQSLNLLQCSLRSHLAEIKMVLAVSSWVGPHTLMPLFRYISLALILLCLADSCTNLNKGCATRFFRLWDFFSSKPASQLLVVEDLT